MTNYYSSVDQTSHSRQLSPQSQINLKPSQKVYLYGDIKYTGTLIHPLERTYPLRWTVELDRGGYDSAIIDNITPIEPYLVESNPEISKNNSPEQTIAELEKEIIALKKENALIKQENQQLSEELKQAKQIIHRAKDISPVIRLSLQRVMRLANQACMDIKRTVGGWILKMGDKARKFRRLADIWEILSQDRWYLSDIFPEDKLISLDKIQSHSPRKRQILPDKQTMSLIHSEKVLVSRLS
jgi:hypothetical protein